MGWTRDASGLVVKRVRGKTIPQWIANARMADQDARWTRRQKGNGTSCHPETMNGRRLMRRLAEGKPW